MMKRFIAYLALFFMAILTGVALHNDSGYMLISYQHWTIESPLWLAILFFLLAVVLFYVLLKIGGLISDLPKRYGRWIKARQLIKAHVTIQKGLIEWLIGRYALAEALWLSSAPQSDIPFVHYLGATLAAAHYDDNKKEMYFQKAYFHCPSHQKWVLEWIKAQESVKEGRYKEAIPLLQQLKPFVPQAPAILQALLTVYQEMEDWEALFKLLPGLKQYNLLTSNELKSLEVKIHAHLLMHEAKSFEDMKKIWKRVPRALRQEPAILAAYCRQLEKFKKPDEAIKLLSDHLYRSWDLNLVTLFGEIKTEHPEKQFSLGEHWLKYHRQDSELFLTLGRLAMRFKYWMKAEEYLLASANIRPSVEVYQQLGQLYEQINNTPRALNTYKKGILLTSGERAKDFGTNKAQ